MSDHNISTLESACVVVVRRGGVTRTKQFSYARFGGQRAALREARAWRDSMLDALPPAKRWSGPRPRPLANKRSNQPVGVSEFVGGDGRLRYSVNWVDADGVSRVKTFSAGDAKSASPEIVRKAERAARRFRRAYEQARKAGTEFDPTQFNDWR